MTTVIIAVNLLSLLYLYEFCIDELSLGFSLLENICVSFELVKVW